MQEATVSLLITWQNFYVIIGSAAAALTGLMFVVITLISRNGRRRSSTAFAAFGTPNVVHFAVALLIAALLTAPWPVLWQASFPLGIAGLGGVIYVAIVTRRTRQQTDYQPVLEDWLGHVIFPFIAYMALVVAAFMLPPYPEVALFVVGAASILLLFIGIHNAWDAVTYITLIVSQSENKSKE